MSHGGEAGLGSCCWQHASQSTTTTISRGAVAFRMRRGLASVLVCLRLHTGAGGRGQRRHRRASGAARWCVERVGPTTKIRPPHRPGCAPRRDTVGWHDPAAGGSLIQPRTSPKARSSSLSRQALDPTPANQRYRWDSDKSEDWWYDFALRHADIAWTTSVAIPALPASRARTEQRDGDGQQRDEDCGSGRRPLTGDVARLQVRVTQIASHWQGSRPGESTLSLFQSGEISHTPQRYTTQLSPRSRRK